jgi:hypothetical protein
VTVAWPFTAAIRAPAANRWHFEHGAFERLAICASAAGTAHAAVRARGLDALPFRSRLVLEAPRSAATGGCVVYYYAPLGS